MEEQGLISVFTGKIKLKNLAEYDVEIIEEEKLVDSIYKKLKEDGVVKFFMPRKNKIIIKFKATVVK